MRLSADVVTALLTSTGKESLAWSPVPMQRWPSVKGRLLASGCEFIAAPLGQRGYHVVSTCQDLATLTGELAASMPTAALCLLLTHCDLDRVAICQEWATLLLAVQPRTQPQLRLVGSA